MEVVDKATGQSYIIGNFAGNNVCAPDVAHYNMRNITPEDDDNIIYNQETDQYESVMDTIQWWLDYVDGMLAMTKKYKILLDALWDLDANNIDIEDWRQDIGCAIGTAQGCDYEQHAGRSLLAMHDWIIQHVGGDANQQALLDIIE